ncbi:LysR family transcriptional regulator (plasmid) [Phyllobacteriaceae bacterium JZ32]
MKSALIKDYEAFVAVATAGSFVGGAQALGITPSAMSQIIRRLEDRVGIQLFHRTTRSISTTDQGERLLARLRVAFQEIDAATKELSERRNRPAGTVRIVLPRVAYDDLLAPLLPAMNAAFPEIVLEVRLNDAKTDIVSEGYDIGFRLGEYINPETVAFPVGPPLRQIAVASPGYIAAYEAPTHPRDLAHHRCINWRQHPDMPPYSWEFGKGQEQITISVQGSLIINDRNAAIRAAMDGLGIAMWVEHRLSDAINSGMLVALLEEWCPYYQGFHVYYYRDRHISAATRAVLDFLRNNAVP